MLVRTAAHPAHTLKPPLHGTCPPRTCQENVVQALHSSSVCGDDRTDLWPITLHINTVAIEI